MAQYYGNSNSIYNIMTMAQYFVYGSDSSIPHDHGNMSAGKVMV